MPGGIADDYSATACWPENYPQRHFVFQHGKRDTTRIFCSNSNKQKKIK
jgi:hypothetical protein